VSLSLKEVLDVAALARIGIGEAEARAVQAELNRIFELIGRMQKVDTEGIAPMTHAQGLALRLRPDQVTESDQREVFQSIAPQTEAGLYLVPRVVE
jgi:aspartyl-tRNA(Asn)/glutamyl-tRNA(Gln) amidotransferase subunit C